MNILPHSARKVNVNACVNTLKLSAPKFDGIKLLHILFLG